MRHDWTHERPWIALAPGVKHLFLIGRAAAARDCDLPLADLPAALDVDVDLSVDPWADTGTEDTRAWFALACVTAEIPVPRTLSDLAAVLTDLGVFTSTPDGGFRTAAAAPFPTEVLPLPAEWASHWKAHLVDCLKLTRLFVSYLYDEFSFDVDLAITARSMTEVVAATIDDTVTVDGMIAMLGSLCDSGCITIGPDPDGYDADLTDGWQGWFEADTELVVTVNWPSLLEQHPRGPEESDVHQVTVPTPIVNQAGVITSIVDRQHEVRIGEPERQAIEAIRAAADLYPDVLATIDDASTGSIQIGWTDPNGARLTAYIQSTACLPEHTVVPLMDCLALLTGPPAGYTPTRCVSPGPVVTAEVLHREWDSVTFMPAVDLVDAGIADRSARERSLIEPHDRTAIEIEFEDGDRLPLPRSLTTAVAALVPFGRREDIAVFVHPDTGDVALLGDKFIAVS